VTQWMLPCGAMGAVGVGAWLVEAKRGAIENMARMLMRLFIPLFAVVLLGFLGTMVVDAQRHRRREECAERS